jgi:hypothetical protein
MGLLVGVHGVRAMTGGLTSTGLLGVRRHGEFWLVESWKVVVED